MIKALQDQNIIITLKKGQKISLDKDLEKSLVEAGLAITIKNVKNAGNNITKPVKHIKDFY